MLKAKPQRRASFFWTGLLITLPVVVLAAAGLVSIRQDRMLVEHEVMERAQDLADGLIPAIWNALVNDRDSETPVFALGATGAVVFPPAFPPTPHPGKLRGEDLSVDQLALWQAAAADSEGGLERWQALLGSNPPANYSAAAHYALGLRLLENGEKRSAAEHFVAVTRQFPEAVGETGLAMAPLAEFKLLALAMEGSPGEIGMGHFCSNIVHRPTALTPYLLKAAAELAETSADRQACEGWARTLSRHEVARSLAAVVADTFRTVSNLPPVLWIPSIPKEAGRGGAPGCWLVVQAAEENEVRRFVCRQQNDVSELIATTLARGARIPAYFAVELRIGGEKLPEFVASGAAVITPDAKVLAAATRLEGGTEALRVTVSLADRNALFKRQRVRSFWFGLLIAAASATALIGFGGMWRAYARQRSLNELKSNFVSSVSHELRAPIASVRLMAESLDRGKITDQGKQRDYFRFISQECRRLSGLIENVLDFARIEQGRKQYEFEPADLLALVRSTTSVMEPYAAEREVKLTFQCAPSASEGLPLTVDAKALQQALVNLVDNAIKHSAPNAVVTVGLDPGEAIRIWVEDHGPGIPAEEHEKIFERFYRRGSELRRETQGVGIGLSIVKHIVEAHHGRVTVRSAPGEGSRFTIELPVSPPTNTH